MTGLPVLKSVFTVNQKTSHIHYNPAESAQIGLERVCRPLKVKVVGVTMTVLAHMHTESSVGAAVPRRSATQHTLFGCCSWIKTLAITH